MSNSGSIPRYYPLHKTAAETQADDSRRADFAMGYAERRVWGTAHMIAGSIRNPELQRNTIAAVAALQYEQVERAATGEADDEHSY